MALIGAHLPKELAAEIDVFLDENEETDGNTRHRLAVLKQNSQSVRPMAVKARLASHTDLSKLFQRLEPVIERAGPQVRETRLETRPIIASASAACTVLVEMALIHASDYQRVALNIDGLSLVSGADPHVPHQRVRKTSMRQFPPSCTMRQGLSGGFRAQTGLDKWLVGPRRKTGVFRRAKKIGSFGGEPLARSPAMIAIEEP
jgi:hypothetical protein